MKKVRFESPNRPVFTEMNDLDCHFPRPFMEKEIETTPPAVPPDISTEYSKILPYSNDIVERYETSNSSPYPVVRKTHLSAHHDSVPKCLPSNDLELSMLDASNQEQPRRPVFSKSMMSKSVEQVFTKEMPERQMQILQSVENKALTPPNVLSRENDFFLRRDNLDKFLPYEANPLQSQLKRLNFDKENNPVSKKVEMMRTATVNPHLTEEKTTQPQDAYKAVNACACHHCSKFLQSSCNLFHVDQMMKNIQEDDIFSRTRPPAHLLHCMIHPTPAKCCTHYINFPSSKILTTNNQIVEQITKPQNAVDKKRWTIENIEQNKKLNCTDIEKQTNIVKEKREPTVSDLFKIIKLQNEQLQLLQEKVDKFISANKHGDQKVQQHMQKSVTEQVALQAVNNEQHKISIGVMTSFEMIHSKIVNKEIVKHTTENAQIQCNRSHISIKEFVSKRDTVNLKFLDGIPPVEKDMQQDTKSANSNKIFQSQADVNEEKTLNELSLYNVHVDNPITPLMSPDQSLYLDVRDYSDSDTDSDDQSNVGWTYYNKVMTHVNGVLQDSDMPSSASALYRNIRQKCVQMQIDKTNVSVTKRVKFGDDPLGMQRPHIYTASTDTSLKMNQLAAKYLTKSPQTPILNPYAPKKIAASTDMSIATRNYMEKHKLLQGLPSTSTSPPVEIPKFLDITALKQQPKLL